MSGLRRSGGGLRRIDPIAELHDKAPIVTIDAGEFFPANGLARPEAVRRWTAAVRASCARGEYPHVTASGVYIVREDPTLGTVFGERAAMDWSGCETAHIDFSGATWMADYQNSLSHVFCTMRNPSAAGDLGKFDALAPAFAQGVVASKTVSTVTIQLDAGFDPLWTQVQRVEEYSRAGDNLNHILSMDFSGGAGVPGWAVDRPSPTTMRIDVGADATARTFIAGMTVGQLYVTTFCVYGGDAIHARGLYNPKLKARILTSAGMGLWLGDCTNPIADITIEPGLNRLISTPADGIQATGNRGKLRIFERCRGTGDDPLNLGVPSYGVATIYGARLYDINIPYPYILTRAGDILEATKPDGTVVSMGYVIDVDISGSRPKLTMSQDVPAGFATTWRVSNMSACPDDAEVDVVAWFCRGHIRASVPNVRGRLIGFDLVGTVLIEHAQAFFGEGSPPDNAYLDVYAMRCATRILQPAAVQVCARALDNHDNIAPVGTINRLLLRVVVDTTACAALLLAGLSGAVIESLVIRNSNFNVSDPFPWAGNAIALVNTSDVRFNSITAFGDVPATVYRSNATGTIFGATSGINVPSGVQMVADGGIVLPSGIAQFAPTSLWVLPSAHPTSENASLRVGDIAIVQDASGNGTRDLSIYNNSTGKIVLQISPNGQDVFLNEAVTIHAPNMRSTAGAAGTLWSDPADGNRVKFVP